MVLGHLSPVDAEKANAAISQHLGLWLNQGKEEKITALYGAATLAVVQKAYSFSVNYSVDWAVETYETAIRKVETAVKDAYPFLSEDSVRVLASCFAYSWK